MIIAICTPFPAGKPGKGHSNIEFTRTLQLEVATKNPFQYKIMTNPVTSI